MSDFNPEEDSRFELLERFKADLRRPVSERFYSEDELVSIFDTAGDQYEDYVRLEVLLLGARLYPDSSELLARRGILYHDTDSVSFQNFLTDNRTTNTNLLEIMRLANLSGSRSQILEEVEKYIRQNELHEDEEVIQFVQMAHLHGLDQWLVDNLEMFKCKVSYLPTLLYEIAILSDESEPFSAISAKVLEELTDLEPYTPEYWTLLSLVYSREERFEDARNAVEYALAIAPDNVDALKAKLRAWSDDSQNPMIDDLLKKIGEADPDDADFAYIRLIREEDRQNFKQIIELIESFPSQVRATKQIVMKAIQYGYPCIDEVFEELYDAGVTEAIDWTEICETSYELKNYEALTWAIRIYHDKSGQTLSHDLLDFRMLFELKKYDLAINVFTSEEASGAIRSPENLFICYAMYVMCLLRTGHTPEADDACTTMLKLIETEPGMPGNSVEKFGMKNFLSDVHKRINALRKTNWQTYDPLGLDRAHGAN